MALGIVRAYKSVVYGLRVNVVPYFERVLYRGIGQIGKINGVVHAYFDTMIKTSRCRSGGEKYKIGEVWVDEFSKWNTCNRGGTVQVFEPPFSIYDKCRDLMSSIARLHRKYIINADSSHVTLYRI